MHYPQTPVDSLDHLSYVPAFDGNDLGQWGAVAAAVAKRVLNGTTKDGQPAVDTGGASGARGANLPGTEQSVPRQPSSITTVSPTIQAQISPQISPTMVQQQSSPGATVGANPYQFMPGGLDAETGISPFTNYGAPGFPTNTGGISPYQPFTRDPVTGQYIPVGTGPGQYSPAPIDAPISIGPARMTDIPWMPIAVIGGAVVLAMMLPRMRRRRTR